MLHTTALSEQFVQAFGGPPTVMVRSPGRVNLIGEHTDYNDGWVFPAALDLGTDVVARRRDDGLLRVVAPIIMQAYQRATGRAGRAYVCTPSAGTHVRDVG